MVVEFSVQNFRSVKKLQTINFATAGLKSPKDYSYIDSENVLSEHNEKCFKVIGLYGLNASGKSNIIKALNYFVELLGKSPSSKSELNDLNQPFLFQEKEADLDSFFQIVFILNEKKYRYGLTVRVNENKTDISTSDEIISSEWLYADSEKNMAPLFIREGNRIITNKLQNHKSIPTKNLYPHNLFLTHASAYDINGESKKITDYFSNYVTSEFEFNHEKFRWITIDEIIRKKNKSKFINLLKSFNIEIDDLIFDEHDDKDVFPQEKVYFVRNGVKFNLKRHESSGTQKLFDLTGLLLRVFDNSIPCFITLDEIDGHFHPALLINLIKMFNNSKINGSKSQLLFSSHDTNIMSPKLMRRDQFYFAEKTSSYETIIYSLADIKGVRNRADFAKDYLAGHYSNMSFSAYCSIEMNDSNE